jgi:hypothetical protein
MNCYKFNLIKNKKGLLDDSIDATYIIHLEGNGRLEHIYDMLKKYKISKIVFILFNKGYKKCKKNKSINNPSLDLIDAFLTIFKDSQLKKFNNILILEDDFAFLPEIKNRDNIKNINKFIKNKENDEFIYYLGCIPYIRMPHINHSNVLLSTGMHACIYSKKLIENILNSNDKINDWDIYINYKFINKKYMYNQLLCYQLIPITENSKNWGNNNFISSFFGKLLFKTFQLLKLNERHDIGYPLFYDLSIINFYIIIVLILKIISSL